MDKDAFKRARVSLDLSLTECARVLGVGEATVTHWQAGRYRIPSWVDERIKELMSVKLASKAERCVRRAIEDRYESMLPRLSLYAVPDGWLPLIEAFLAEVSERLPDALRGGALDLDWKEKWGSLRTSWFVDTEADPEEGAAFISWLDKREEELEAASEKLCARCGSDDDVDFTRSGWRLPLCKRHRLLDQGDL